MRCGAEAGPRRAIGRSTDHPKLNFGDILTERYGGAYVAVSSSSVRVPATSVPSTRIWLQAILSSISQGRHRWAPIPRVWRPPDSKRWPSIYAARPTNTRPRPGFGSRRRVDTITPSQPTANAVRAIARRERY